MHTINIIINHQAGLHARPAALFFKEAIKFHSKIRVTRVKTGKEVDAKSVVAILTLGVMGGEEIMLKADGVDETDALDALRYLIESNFGEV